MHKSSLRDSHAPRPGFATATRNLSGRKPVGRKARVVRAATPPLSPHEPAPGVVAHELRNLLAPLQQQALLLQRLACEPQQVARLSAALQQQLLRLVRVVDDLMDTTGLVTGKLAMQWAPCRPARIAAEVLEMAAAVARDKQQHLDLTLDLEPSLELNADGLRLTQALSNLVLNALRYTPAGGHIRVRVGAEADRVVFEVSDDGIGMAPQAIERLVGLYAQEEAGSGGGLGVGLYLARLIAQAHGGELHAFSDGPGRGSTFRIELPRASAHLRLHA